MKRQFKVDNTDALKIKKWIEGSQQKQFLFDLYFKINYDCEKNQSYHLVMICLILVKFLLHQMEKEYMNLIIQ